MTNFDNEYQALLDWYDTELDKAKDLPDDGVGLDACSERAQQEMKIDKEYRQKLLILKQKYETKPAEPVTKAKTFNQALQPTGT
ncbi:MAG: hypothetical protein FWC89_11315 [Defluviitaleaceae bacterium]|nr:hypothetical protein [Defluviitaleaceae bacterium]